MISAHQAKKITADSASTYLIAIEEGIKKNAALGKYSYEHLLDAEYDIVDEVKARLKQLDFTVKTESRFGLDCVWRTQMTISWGAEEEQQEEA